jgi:hypothetical protein
VRSQLSKMAKARTRYVLTLMMDELFSDSDSSVDETVEDIIVLSSSSHDNSNFRLPRIPNYVERVVPLYSQSGFKEHFRLSSSTFELVLPRIARFIVNKSSTSEGRPTTPPKMCGALYS